jgi:general secretion pathway protein F
VRSFEVTALIGGARIRRVVAAAERTAVGQELPAGSYVLAIRELTGRAKVHRDFSLRLFTQSLIALLEAGLVLVEALEALAESAADTGQKSVLDALLHGLYQGQPLSAAMASLPGVFPPLMVACVAASEHTGQLPSTLRRFYYYEAQLDGLKRRVRGVLLYPTIVIGVGTLIVFFLLFFVVPRFAAVFDQARALSASARVMVTWGTLVNEHGLALAGGAASTLAGLIVLAGRSPVRRLGWRALWRIKRLREKRTLFDLARFYRTVGLLLAGGVPLIDALGWSGALLPQDNQLPLRTALRQIGEGTRASDALVGNGLTTPVAARLLQVGERAGDLPGMCERIAQFHDEAISRAIETFSKVFEPVLMLIVGAVIGGIVFLLYMPIFELTQGMS